MNPDRDDERLEAWLQHFEPRAPRPLPGKPRPHVGWPAVVMVALAAVVLIAVSLLLWQRRMKSAGPQQAVTQQPAQAPAGDEISLAQLSRIAQQEPEKLDSHLDRLSAKLLPDVHDSQGVLNRLSRE